MFILPNNIGLSKARGTRCLRKDRFVQRTVSNIKAGDLKKIEMVLDENKEMIIRTWNSYFDNIRR